jgi:PEP-CTERM motif
MKSAIFVMAALVLLLASGGRTNAGPIVNGGFESGLTAWTANPGSLVSAVTSYQTYGPNFLPVQGQYFALLTAGAGPNTYTTLSQGFTANAGDVISGYAFFQANDYIPYNDDGYVKIIENGVTLFQSNVSAVGDYGNTPWTAFSYTFNGAGSYTIEAGVRNDIDNNLSSALGLDAVAINGNGTVTSPEPASMTLLVAGIAGMAGYGWRRRKQAATA